VLAIFTKKPISLVAILVMLTKIGCKGLWEKMDANVIANTGPKQNNINRGEFWLSECV
jgi:hypothetical protein